MSAQPKTAGSTASGAQHTPGPWRQSMGRAVNCPARNIQIASVIRVGGYGADDETTANACLLAAAPDLLAVLRRCDVELAEIVGATHADVERIQRARFAVRDALAKVQP